MSDFFRDVLPGRILRCIFLAMNNLRPRERRENKQEPEHTIYNNRDHTAAYIGPCRRIIIACHG